MLSPELIGHELRMLSPELKNPHNRFQNSLA